VNLVTKTAGERPTINISGMGGYTPIVNGRGLVETAGTVGQRFGANKRFGALIGGTYDWNGRGIDDLEPVPDIAKFTDGSTARYFESIDVREYRYYRSRWDWREVSTTSRRTARPSTSVVFTPTSRTTATVGFTR